MEREIHTSMEIFGAPGVGKTTFIRKNGWISSHDEYHKALDNLIKDEFKKKIFIAPPRNIVRMFRDVIRNRYDEQAIKDFGSRHKEFLDICVFIIFNSPVSAERKVECYKFFINAILSWWLVKDRAGMVWDESFAKVVLYSCGMKPDFSDNYFRDIVRVMPKRGRYILLDGEPVQGVAGQIKRGKFDAKLSTKEKNEKLKSAEKYRSVANKLSYELLNFGCLVEKQISSITCDVET